MLLSDTICLCQRHPIPNAESHAGRDDCEAHEEAEDPPVDPAHELLLGDPPQVVLGVGHPEGRLQDLQELQKSVLRTF